MIVESFHRSSSINKGNYGKVQHSPPKTVPKQNDSNFMEPNKMPQFNKNTNYNNPKHPQDVLNLEHKN